MLSETAKLLPEYQFIVAGNGPDDACLKDVPNITLAGFLNGDRLTDLMANAKLLIAPSVCYENCPLSILESHSMGVPVVTMNSGGMAELVEDGKTGVLASAPTPEAVAEAVRKCLSDEAFYTTLRRNCEAISEQIMDVTEYCKLIIEQYHKLR